MAEADPNIADAHTRTPPLKGRKAIVTGGTTGIGRALAVLLASEGVEIFTCGRNEEHLRNGLERINQVGRGSGIAVDLAGKDGLDRFFDEAGRRLGDYDIAIINAAIPIDGVTQTSEDEARYGVAVDFVAYVMSAHKAARAMKDKGDLIMIGSMSAHYLGASSSIYSGVKSGIQGFAEALRKELGPKGIKVGLVEPGMTGADFQLPDIPVEKQREMINADKMLRAEDIAVAVHFMLTQPRRAVVQQLAMTERIKQ
jgi:NAD(P)-dependent dehydrogenase (short-subunit alcohol dehydrogenase family)